MTTFLRILDARVDDKASVLLSSIEAIRSGERPGKDGSDDVFEVTPAELAEIPTTPFAYWLPPSLKRIFADGFAFRDGERFACNGASTCDDFRYLRLWWECAPRGSVNGRRFVSYNQGAKFTRFMKEVPVVVPWDEARQTFVGFIGRPGRWQASPVGAENYFLPALTWPLRGVTLSVQAVPAGCAFSVGGKVAVAPATDLPWLLALLNSRVADYAVRVFAGKVGGVQYESGLIERVPLPVVPKEDREVLGDLATRGWRLKRALSSAKETSHAFLLPWSLNTKVTGLDPNASDRELDRIQGEIDGRIFALYNIGATDRAVIEASKKVAFAEGVGSDERIEGDEGEEEFDGASLEPEGAVLSWLVGVVFGRFDPRLATGERAPPPDPGPFDALPLRSPAMWPEREAPARLPDILVDDEGHPEDLVVGVFSSAVRSDCGPLSQDLRSWIAKDFFQLHIKAYSESRRKAPIYWQLATPSANYSVWLYIHAFTKDTLFRIQNDFVGPKLAHEERRLEAMSREQREKATAVDRKALAAQESFVEELRAFLDEVKRVAPMWKPNLDDGVIINFAPLWRLVPQHKPWQKELKATWDALCDGEYDWAQLAMHLWPERVVPKCAKDRSIAIAHALEEVFWVEDAEGKWAARTKPTRSFDELVRERTSPAVKAALKSLLEAPVAAGGGGRGRGGRGRKATSAAEGEGR